MTSEQLNSRYNEDVWYFLDISIRRSNEFLDKFPADTVMCSFSERRTEVKRDLASQAPSFYRLALDGYSAFCLRVGAGRNHLSMKTIEPRENPHRIWMMIEQEFSMEIFMQTKGVVRGKKFFVQSRLQLFLYDSKCTVPGKVNKNLPKLLKPQLFLHKLAVYSSEL